jgi:hypothetical protein
MGLLDDLKRQAEHVKTQQLSQQSLRADAQRLVEEKMAQAFHYLNDLLKQLAVLKPGNEVVFSIPGIGDFKDLQFEESFIDYRKKRVNDRELFDLVSFYIRWGSPAKIAIERDMPAAAVKVREVLFTNGIKFTEEEVKNARYVVTGWKFAIESGIVTDIKIQADSDEGRLFVKAKNLMRLGPDDFVVPAGDVDEAWLEDFAMTLLGKPGSFRKYRAAVAPTR